MVSAEAKNEQPEPQAPRLSEPIPFVYTNAMTVTFSPFDFVFTMSMNMPGGRILAGQMAMSAQHAKIFNEILAQKLVEYESAFGAILNREELNQRVEAFNESRRIAGETDQASA